jgi:Uma2 family endonuclease
MTVEQYRELPARDETIEELHRGTLVSLPRPPIGHSKLQARLARLLHPKLETSGVVETEVAFRALPEYDLRGADVAFVTQQRWDETDDDDNLHGSPELVIEVLSPSNTKAEIYEKAVLCPSTGCEEFWVVDPKRNAISVTARGSDPVTYVMGDRIPLPKFQSDIEVAEISAKVRYS